MECSHSLKHAVILIKGAGEKASAVAHRLSQCGFRKIVMTERPFPMAERREVSFCEALFDGQKEVCSVLSRKAEISVEAVKQVWSCSQIALLEDPDMKILDLLSPDILIDAVMAKRNTGTTSRLAPLVIALGPGFSTPQDAHFVVETNPNSDLLGRLVSKGGAETDTGIPTLVSHLASERLIRAPSGGLLHCLKKIGDRAEKNEVIGYVGESPVVAAISGVIWGIVRNGAQVEAGRKIGDIDPRGKKDLCHRITPQARAIAGGVLEGILRFLNGPIPDDPPCP